jgi:hypothetical protein
MMRNRIVITTAAAALALTGCTIETGGSDAEPTKPAEVEQGDTLSETDLNQELMQMAWDSIPQSDKDAMCQFPDLSAGVFYKEAVKGSNPTGLTLADAESFFNSHC